MSKQEDASVKDASENPEPYPHLIHIEIIMAHTSDVHAAPSFLVSPCCRFILLPPSYWLLYLVPRINKYMNNQTKPKGPGRDDYVQSLSVSDATTST